MVKKEDAEVIHRKREVGERYEMDFGELVEKVHFGSFAVIMTSRGALYETYTGYHVWTTPYAADKDGQVREKSLYAWLKNLVEVSKMADKVPDARVEGSEVTYGDLLDAMKITTEANLVHPMSAFVDEQRAMKFATEYMDWLNVQYGRLKEASEKGRSGDEMADEAALALERARLAAGETINGMRGDGNGRHLD